MTINIGNPLKAMQVIVVNIKKSSRIMLAVKGYLYMCEAASTRTGNAFVCRNVKQRILRTQKPVYKREQECLSSIRNTNFFGLEIKTVISFW